MNVASRAGDCREERSGRRGVLVEGNSLGRASCRAVYRGKNGEPLSMGLWAGAKRASGRGRTSGRGRGYPSLARGRETSLRRERAAVVGCRERDTVGSVEGGATGRRGKASRGGRSYGLQVEGRRDSSRVGRSRERARCRSRPRASSRGRSVLAVEALVAGRFDRGRSSQLAEVRKVKPSSMGLWSNSVPVRGEKAKDPSR
jgi:hypothetical protein